MHILLTGSSGAVGSGVLLHLLEQNHTVVALDIVPLPDRLLSQVPPSSSSRLTTHVMDLCDFKPLDELFKTSSQPFDGVIHLSAIPHPIGSDPRTVHNNNVTSSYNVLTTAVMYGVKRIVQASSVNAIGLTYTPEGLQRFEALPLTEESPFVEMDSYALSKHVCELQAASLCRVHPDLRIASLRFHMVRPDYASSWPDADPTSLYSWVSLDACARACLQGITSTGWTGAEAFNIVAPEICWEGGLTKESQRKLGEPEVELLGTLEVLESQWKGRYDLGKLDKGWWEGRPRRALWDCSKAERMLGWKHDL